MGNYHKATLVIGIREYLSVTKDLFAFPIEVDKCVPIAILILTGKLSGDQQYFLVYMAYRNAGA